LIDQHGSLASRVVAAFLKAARDRGRSLTRMSLGAISGKRVKGSPGR
jgi:hypothetical protein